jgi:hypothetical protein
MTPFLALVLTGYAVFMVALAVVWLQNDRPARRQPAAKETAREIPKDLAA